MFVEGAADIATSSGKPLFIRWRDRYLFAWHHVARSETRRGAMAVLCPPLGFDYICVYRSWRILAERLAADGFDVVRFDYDGTGNSAGDHDEPLRVQAWLDSIEHVITEGRRITGCSSVVLIGLRLGAILALHAAAARRGGVDGLVLWSPFQTGRSFVRELAAFAGVSRQDHVQEASDVPDICAAGYIVKRTTVEELCQLDVKALTARPAPEVLLVDRDDRPATPAIAARLEQLGARVARVRPEGTAKMLVQPAVSQVPTAVIDAIAGWLDAWRSTTALPKRGTSTIPTDHTIGRGSGWFERSVRFGPDGRLFGILTIPARESVPRPAVIFLNTGAEYHAGPSRLYVPLARTWAAAGHLVMRFDQGGIGDSLPPPGAKENIIYSAHAIDDLREALAFVKRTDPRRALVVIGLCSGGWHAFRAVRDALPVDAIASINPPLFLRDRSWTGERLREYLEVNDRRPRLDLSPWPRLRALDAACRSFLRVLIASIRRTVLTAFQRSLGRPMGDGLATDLQEITARGVPSLFVFSRGDPALDYFQLHGGVALRQRRERDCISHLVVDNAGHSFQPSEAQRALQRVLTDFVAQQTAHAKRADPLSRIGS
jgi:pimeloyl-ACP methyl ester carboxylesterase